MNQTGEGNMNTGEAAMDNRSFTGLRFVRIMGVMLTAFAASAVAAHATLILVDGWTVNDDSFTDDANGTYSEVSPFNASSNAGDNGHWEDTSRFTFSTGSATWTFLGLANGEYEGMNATSEKFRNLFDRQSVLDSDWYKIRLERKISLDTKLMNKNLEYLHNVNDSMVKSPMNAANIKGIEGKIKWVEEQLQELNKADSWKSLIGTLGADPLHR